MKRITPMLILVSMLLAACGDGGGDGPSDVDTTLAPGSGTTSPGSGGTSPQGGGPASTTPTPGTPPTGPSRVTMSLNGADHVFDPVECDILAFDGGGVRYVGGGLMSPGAMVELGFELPPPTQNSALYMNVTEPFDQGTIKLRLGDTLWIVQEFSGLSRFDSHNTEFGDGWSRSSGTATFHNESARVYTGETVTATGTFDLTCIEGEGAVLWEESDFLVTIEVDGEKFELHKSEQTGFSTCVVHGEDVRIQASSTSGDVSLRIEPRYEQGTPQPLGMGIVLDLPSVRQLLNWEDIATSPAFQISGSVATWTGELSNNSGESRTVTITADCTHRPGG